MKNKDLVIIDPDQDSQAENFVELAKSRLSIKKPQKGLVSIRLDKDVVDFLKSQTREKYQTDISTILRAFTESPVEDVQEALKLANDKQQAKKKRTSIRLDEDVLTSFKEKGEGYQTLINDVLRVFMVYSAD